MFHRELNLLSDTYVDDGKQNFALRMAKIKELKEQFPEADINEVDKDGNTLLHKMASFVSKVRGKNHKFKKMLVQYIDDLISLGVDPRRLNKKNQRFTDLFLPESEEVLIRYHQNGIQGKNGLLSISCILPKLISVLIKRNMQAEISSLLDKFDNFIYPVETAISPKQKISAIPAFHFALNASIKNNELVGVDALDEASSIALYDFLMRTKAYIAHHQDIRLKSYYSDQKIDQQTRQLLLNSDELSKVSEQIEFIRLNLTKFSGEGRDIYLKLQEINNLNKHDKNIILRAMIDNTNECPFLNLIQNLIVTLKTDAEKKEEYGLYYERILDVLLELTRAYKTLAIRYELQKLINNEEIDIRAELQKLTDKEGDFEEVAVIAELQKLIDDSNDLIIRSELEKWIEDNKEWSDIQEAAPSSLDDHKFAKRYFDALNDAISLREYLSLEDFHMKAAILNFADRNSFENRFFAEKREDVFREVRDSYDTKRINLESQILTKNKTQVIKQVELVSKIFKESYPDHAFGKPSFLKNHGLFKVNDMNANLEAEPRLMVENKFSK